MKALMGKFTLVTGASRGAGKGIAIELGAAGATVYVTGRSRPGTRSSADLPGTIDETAAAVTASGGRGIPVVCDHLDDAQVEALFAQIKRDSGRLDLLVNNVWGGYEEYDGEAFTRPFWEQPVSRWDRMFTTGARAHFTASRLAAPLMIAQGSGLIVNTSFYDRGKYLGSLPYDTVKAAINRMAYGMALELRPHRIAALALSPGWMRTEAVLHHHQADEATWQESPELRGTESPRYIGRAIVALAVDPEVLRHSGAVLTVGDLAAEYGFTDIDGRTVPAFRIPPEHATD
jgi:NAD(P)-dependent dehydrogenase (short-subunit alcohol dehydrogenase family)